MKKPVFSLLILFLLCFSFQSLAQSEQIKSIKIKSLWTGLGPTSKSSLLIKQNQGKFYINDKNIDSELITNLLKEIESDEQFNLESFGITQDWLNQNADEVAQQYLKNTSPSAREYFLQSFLNYAKIREIFPMVLSGGWTDDYPRFEMIITKKDSSKIKIYSGEQVIFMLPWSITDGKNSYVSGNPKLSRAIAALLPENFTNKKRINGNYLLGEIVEKLKRELSEDLNRLESQDKIGNELSRLKDRYIIKKTEISSLSSIDVGTPKNAFQSDDYKTRKGPSWNAKLQRKDLPSNVIIGVSLRYISNRLETFDVFLEKIDKIVEHTLSIPWLSKYIAAKPETEFEIRFVEDRSFSPRGYENFLEDLEVFGPNSLNSELKSELEESVFLQVSEKFPSQWSRWLILPDKRMILWQIKGESVFNWKPSDFETRNLYNTKDWFQTKAIILPNGEIESR